MSLYNETLGAAIFPTPVVGIVGTLPTAPPVPLHFIEEGHTVLLIGGLGSTDARQFGSSQFAKVVLDQLWGIPPRLDMDLEKRVQSTIRELVRAGAVSSAHDLGDGGLAVALAEASCGPHSIGAVIDLQSDLSPEFTLFHPKRHPALFWFRRQIPKAVYAAARENSVPVTEIGATLKARLVIRNRTETRSADSSQTAGEPQTESAHGGLGRTWIDCSVGDLFTAWNTGLGTPPPYFNSGGLMSQSQDLPVEDSFLLPFDKLHEECGVFAIYGHPEAANLAYLGLYALQHRGQESAGIASSDGRKIHNIRKMGHVADIFTPDVLNQLPGELAIGHTRYSTTGDTVLLQNAGPLSTGGLQQGANRPLPTMATSPMPPKSVGTLKMRAPFFRATTDTEVILHLVAKSRERTLPGCPPAMRCFSSRELSHSCSWPRIASSSPATRMVFDLSPWAASINRTDVPAGFLPPRPARST